MQICLFIIKMLQINWSAFINAIETTSDSGRFFYLLFIKDAVNDHIILHETKK